MFLSGPQFAAPVPSPSYPQQAAPDNTKMNKGDAQQGALTADQQWAKVSHVIDSAARIWS